MSKKQSLRGCGSIHINNTPGEKDYTIESKDVIKKLDELKKEIINSRLKVDKYNLTVRTPKDINKGYKLPKYIQEGFKSAKERREFLKKQREEAKKPKEKPHKQGKKVQKIKNIEKEEPKELKLTKHKQDTDHKSEEKPKANNKSNLELKEELNKRKIEVLIKKSKIPKLDLSKINREAIEKKNEEREKKNKSILKNPKFKEELNKNIEKKGYNKEKILNVADHVNIDLGIKEHPATLLKTKQEEETIKKYQQMYKKRYDIIVEKYNNLLEKYKNKENISKEEIEELKKLIKDLNNLYHSQYIYYNVPSPAYLSDKFRNLKREIKEYIKTGKNEKDKIKRLMEIFEQFYKVYNNLFVNGTNRIDKKKCEEINEEDYKILTEFVENDGYNHINKGIRDKLSTIFKYIEKSKETKQKKSKQTKSGSGIKKIDQTELYNLLKNG